MESINVLAVEDNLDDVSLMAEFLAADPRDDFRIATATTLAEAVSTMAESSFDVVLLDLSLPDTTGIDTVKQFVAAFPKTAVVVLTGLDDEEVAIQAVKYGAQDYLEKRFISSMGLGRAIRHAIERRQIMAQQEALLSELSAALRTIDMLHRILPICAHCKKIRNDRGEWEAVEGYLNKQLGTDFSHGICPACIKRYYAEFDE